jgi:hypothetical protein
VREGGRREGGREGGWEKEGRSKPKSDGWIWEFDPEGWEEEGERGREREREGEGGRGERKIDFDP